MQPFVSCLGYLNSTAFKTLKYIYIYIYMYIYIYIHSVRQTKNRENITKLKEKLIYKWK